MQELARLLCTALGCCLGSGSQPPPAAGLLKAYSILTTCLSAVAACEGTRLCTACAASVVSAGGVPLLLQHAKVVT